MTESDLRDAGYKRYASPAVSNAAFLWQRPVLTADNQRAYFVNVYEYDFGRPDMPPDTRERLRFDAEIHLYLTPDDCFRVKRSCYGLSVADLEAFIARLYRDNACVPDGCNN